MGLIDWLEIYLQNDDTKLIYILALILIANILDFLMGWLKAKILPEQKFSSARATFGIARKIILFILLVLFIPFSLLLPDIIGLSALYVLYMGYLVTELFSILGHLNIETDHQIGLFYKYLNKYYDSDDNSEKIEGE